MTVEPLGFPNCPSCPYARNGFPEVCAACVASSTAPVPDDHCPTCCQRLAPGGECGNAICHWSLSHRHFTQVDAIAMFSGDLASYLKFFKYNPQGRGWAVIFGRLIVGWLDRVRPPVDLILGNPSASSRQPHQHVELMLQAAKVEDPRGRWPFVTADEPVLVKTEETEKSAGNGWQAKMLAAEKHAEAMEIVDPERLQGAHVLLVDDVFTTGAQFVTVSKVLRRAGAADVRGLVIARTGWRL